MAKQFKKTKLAAAVCAAAGLGLASSANAVVVVGGDNGWEVSFDGNINAFYTTGDYDAGYSTLGFAGTSNARDVSRVASGFLPAFFSFNVKSPTVNGMTATGRFSFAPVIQNGNAKNQTYATGLTGNGATNGIQGSSIDMREVVVNLDGNFGTVSFGRTLSIFGRQAILKDMTLFGVGASFSLPPNLRRAPNVLPRDVVLPILCEFPYIIALGDVIVKWYCCQIKQRLRKERL